MFKSLSLRVVVALVLGIAAGAWVRAAGGEGAHEGAEIVRAIGGLWLNALRMTVVPLVFALLVTGIASFADAAATGKLAMRAILLFVVLLFAAALYSVAATSGLIALWPIDAQAASGIVASAEANAETAQTPPDFAAWLQGLAPANVVRAAAEDAILALVVFAVFFGFAATRLPETMKTQLVDFFRAVAAAMIVIVHWVLLAAPIGVFALALGVGMTAGIGAAGVLVQYVIIVSAVTAGVALIAIALASVWGGLPVARILPAFAPPLVVAASTQSSLATLPAMLEATRENLKIPARITDLVLPLAVAVFRMTSPVANLAVAFFIAALYGLEPGPLQISAAIFVAFAVSVGSVGLPGQISFFASMAPICLALGVPLEMLGILIAVEVIPDIFRTLGNVSADMAVTAIVNRQEEKVGAPAASP